MGTLPGGPAFFPGTPHLVIPDYPTPEEAIVYDQAVRLFTDYVNRELVVDTWSQYHNQTPSIWLGTLARFPRLAAALDSAEIAGLGATTHSEEYQLLVQDDRVLLGGSDLRALRWGLQSLEVLMSDIMGQLSIDRVYIRDWPDLNKRISTINSPVRNESQSYWSNLVADVSYNARMNEIEWNDPDSGFPDRKVYPIEQTRLLATKIRNCGMLLTMSADQTAYKSTELHWQEGIPIIGTPMKVAEPGFMTIASGFGFQTQNGNFESWSGNRPSYWEMYRDDRYSYLLRDNVTRHSGISSAKFTNFTGAPCDTDLRQCLRMERNRAYKIVFWYKLSGYKGQIRICDYRLTVPHTKTNQIWLDFSTPTTQDWTKGEAEFFSFNLDSTYLMIGPSCPTQGTLWLDDITVEVVEPQDIVRRSDTPLEVYKRQTHQLMTEGVDYRVVETQDETYNQFVASPRFERVNGGRLAVNDTVDINWSWAFLFENKRKTICFSTVEPLIEYQDRIARLDSFLHPDGFKIHINEVTYAGYDLTCTRRGMTPAQLVGSYCRQMYQIIQARRPGALVRSYGDAFDIFVNDPRGMPTTISPWTIGALQELPEPVEMLAMVSYSSSTDSSLTYFTANHHPSVVALGLYGSFPRVGESVLAASRHEMCNGMQTYFWTGNEDELRWKLAEFGNLSWNFGPYILSSPLEYSYRPDSLVFTCEAWSDTFNGSYSPQITSCFLRYRLLPGGGWNVLTMTPTGRDQYSAVVRNFSAAVTEAEYYFRVTDNRDQVSMAPADAPQTTFIVSLPFESGQSGGSGGEEIPFSTHTLPGYQLLEWAPEPNADWYELHRSATPDFGTPSQTLIARQSPNCPRFLMLMSERRADDASPIHIFVIRDENLHKQQIIAVKR